LAHDALRIRAAIHTDQDAIFALVEQFATSFQPERAAFDHSLLELLTAESVWLGVAEITTETETEIVGYCLGIDHYTFYANGRVAWVEEITVREDARQQGVGRALMAAFEAWALAHGSRLVALATRRAAPFYAALGYEESAIYFRKVLTHDDKQ
jgi:GNAT superfamily N-acetyltransferase